MKNQSSSINHLNHQSQNHCWNSAQLEIRFSFFWKKCSPTILNARITKNYFWTMIICVWNRHSTPVLHKDSKHRNGSAPKRRKGRGICRGDRSGQYSRAAIHLVAGRKRKRNRCESEHYTMSASPESELDLYKYRIRQSRNSTQLNSTQRNSTQLNSTWPPLTKEDLMNCRQHDFKSDLELSVNNEMCVPVGTVLCQWSGRCVRVHGLDRYVNHGGRHSGRPRRKIATSTWTSRRKSFEIHRNGFSFRQG